MPLLSIDTPLGLNSSLVYFSGLSNGSPTLDGASDTAFFTYSGCNVVTDLVSSPNSTPLPILVTTPDMEKASFLSIYYLLNTRVIKLP